MKVNNKLFCLSVVMLAATGIFCAHRHKTQLQSGDVALANIEALTNGNGESSDSGSESGGSSYEYPNGYPYTFKCNVAIGKTWYGGVSRCQVEVITCQGGGSGCNSKKCPVHPA